MDVVILLLDKKHRYFTQSMYSYMKLLNQHKVNRKTLFIAVLTAPVLREL